MAGFDDCDDVAYNGCETDLALDPRHCGACDIRCDNGQCVDGECQAAAGYVNCNLSWDDGFEAHLQSDSNNCGECDRDCQGGSCVDGRCEPFLVTEPGLWALELRTDATHLYFCEYWTESIMRIPQRGGPVEVLAVDQGCGYSLSVAGDKVYWDSDVGEDVSLTLVIEASLQSGGTTVIGSAESIWSIRARGDTVAWGASADDGTEDETIVVRDGATAAPVEVYRTMDNLGALALTDDHVFFLEYVTYDDPIQLMKIPLAGGAATPIADLGSEGVDGLQATGEHLWWIEWIEEESDVYGYRLMQLPLASSTPIELYHGQNGEKSYQYVPLHADDSGAYWSEQEGVRLLYVGPEGGDPLELASYQEIEELTAGRDAIFWHDYPGKILGLAKETTP
jgi:hypothetical protein